MSASDKSLFALSYDLQYLDRRDFLTAAAASIAQLLPVEHLGWIDATTDLSRVDMVTRDGGEQPAITEALIRTAAIHPLTVSLSADPKSLTPRRMSDLIALRDWKKHAVYNDLFRLMGTTYQITVPVSPYQRGLQAWVFNRAATDFSDDELVFTSRLQPLLATLNRASAQAFIPDAETSVRMAARFGLTDRELEVLQLLVQGFTSAQIGYYHRISARTVEKHLQNAYLKLGAHDRVHAVQIAIRSRLVAF